MNPSMAAPRVASESSFVLDDTVSSPVQQAPLHSSQVSHQEEDSKSINEAKESLVDDDIMPIAMEENDTNALSQFANVWHDHIKGLGMLPLTKDEAFDERVQQGNQV